MLWTYLLTEFDAQTLVGRISLRMVLSHKFGACKQSSLVAIRESVSAEVAGAAIRNFARPTILLGEGATLPDDVDFSKLLVYDEPNFDAYEMRKDFLEKKSDGIVILGDIKSEAQRVMEMNNPFSQFPLLNTACLLVGKPVDTPFAKLIERDMFAKETREALTRRIQATRAARARRDPMYPHVCPKCGAPAYVGVVRTSCMIKCDQP